MWSNMSTNLKNCNIDGVIFNVGDDFINVKVVKLSGRTVLQIEGYDTLNIIPLTEKCIYIGIEE